MAKTLTVALAALALALSWGLSTQAAQAKDKKTCVEQCKKTEGSAGRVMTKCVNNCLAAN